MSTYPLPPESENDEDAPACGADPVGPVSGGFLLRWMRKRLRALGGGHSQYVKARTSRIMDRYLSNEPSGGPICYTRVPGSPRLLWVSRVDLVTRFGRGADVELMEQYAATQSAAKRGRVGTRYRGRKPSI